MKNATKQITYARISGYDAAIAASAHADVHVIAAEGELGEREIVDLGDEMVRLACTSRCNLVLDLSAAHHVDYRQVRALAARARLLRSAGGDLKLCGLSGYLQAIFRASGLFADFSIHEDAADATRAFAIER
jgi:anti-sigma B factor antagonist